MAGYIVKRGHRTYQVRIPRGRDGTGKRVYHTKTIKGRKREAERYLTKTQRELDTGTFVEPSQQTLSELVGRWLETSVEPRVRTRTHHDYAALARLHIVPALGQVRLTSLSPADIQALYSALQKRGLSPRTIRYVHSVIHGALEQAVRWRMLSTNPAKLVDLPRMVRHEPRVLGPKEAARFIETAETDRFGALWIVLLTTGLRPSEALGLKWEDLDGNRLRVRRALLRESGGGWALGEPKSARARRVVSLPLIAIRALRRHRAAQSADRLRVGPDWTEHGLVFTTGRGQPLEWRVLARRHFKPLLRRAGLPDIRPYDLRHSCATLLISAGENVKVVSERLGHTSASLTLDVYSHVLPDMQQQAAERLDRILADGPG